MTIRLPDFIIIGAMKSGTTSLFRWLEAQPEFWLPECKEPDFFSRDDVFRKGTRWYASNFAPAGRRITGEASASYTSPAASEIAAARMAAVVPDVRLIYLVRHPLERARSHYRHEVQRGRESRSFEDSVTMGSTYVGHSLYFRRLLPFVRRFPREAICVVRFEDLVGDGHPGWSSVLSHLGVPPRDPPGTAHNVTSQKRQYTRLGAWFWDAGLLQRRLPLPGPVKSLARHLFTSDPPASNNEEPYGDVPDDIATALGSDADELAGWLTLGPLWNLRETRDPPK